MNILIPLKDLAEAKGRLRPLLSDSRRRSLVLAMASDLISLARQQSFVQGVHVVHGDNWDIRLLRGLGAKLLCEKALAANGLNQALSRAAGTLGDGPVLALHADLPFVDQRELVQVQRALREKDLLLCPDQLDRGTNAIAFKGQAPPAFRFGDNSFSLHLAEAQCRPANSWAVHRRAAFARDIDTPDDVQALIESGACERVPGPQTRRWIAEQLAATECRGPNNTRAADMWSAARALT